MFTPAQRAEIRRLYYAEHWKVGTIAAQLGLHRETVRAAVERESPGVPPSVWRPSIIDPYLPFIRDILTQYPRLRATRIHRDGAPARLCRFGLPVRNSCSACGPKQPRRLPPVVTLPGESAQVDWGSFGKVRIAPARARSPDSSWSSGYSRALAALFTLDQTLESFLRGHVHAFDALGGVARNLVYDNLRSAVLDRRGAASVFIPACSSWPATTTSRPAPVRGTAQGERKNREENSIPTPRLLRRPSFRDLDDINAQFRPWRDEVAHRRPHPQQPNRSVAEVWAEEKPRLLPLPANPFETDLVRAVRSARPPTSASTATSTRSPTPTSASR